MSAQSTNVRFSPVSSTGQRTTFVEDLCWGTVAVEAAMTPATYAVVNYVKAHEHGDVYDDDTDFTPFSLEV